MISRILSSLMISSLIVASIAHAMEHSSTAATVVDNKHSTSSSSATSTAAIATAATDLDEETRRLDEEVRRRFEQCNAEAMRKRLAIEASANARKNGNDRQAEFTAAQAQQVNDDRQKALEKSQGSTPVTPKPALTVNTAHDLNDEQAAASGLAQAGAEGSAHSGAEGSAHSAASRTPAEYAAGSVRSRSNSAPDANAKKEEKKS